MLRAGRVTGVVDPTVESNASLSRLMIGLRVTEEEERQGLDISSHGETAYNR